MFWSFLTLRIQLCNIGVGKPLREEREAFSIFCPSVGDPEVRRAAANWVARKKRENTQAPPAPRSLFFVPHLLPT